jgi:hypothetical protein
MPYATASGHTGFIERLEDFQFRTKNQVFVSYYPTFPISTPDAVSFASERLLERHPSLPNYLNPRK